MAEAGRPHRRNRRQGSMGWRGALRRLRTSRWMNFFRSATRPRHAPDLHICAKLRPPLPSETAQSFGVPCSITSPPALVQPRRADSRQSAYVDLSRVLPFEKTIVARLRQRTFADSAVRQLPHHRCRCNGPWFPDARLWSASSRLAPRRGEGDLPHLIEGERRSRRGSRTSPSSSPHAPGDASCLEILRPPASSISSSRTPSTMMPSAPGHHQIGDYGPHRGLRCMSAFIASNPILWHAAARWLLRTKKIARSTPRRSDRLVRVLIPWYGSNDLRAVAIDLLRHPEKLARSRENWMRC